MCLFKSALELNSIRQTLPTHNMTTTTTTTVTPLAPPMCPLGPMVLLNVWREVQGRVTSRSDRMSQTYHRNTESKGVGGEKYTLNSVIFLPQTHRMAFCDQDYVHTTGKMTQNSCFGHM